MRAHVGQGKSFWLTEFIKYATEQEKEVVYYNAIDLANESLEEIENTFKEIETR